MGDFKERSFVVRIFTLLFVFLSLALAGCHKAPKQQEALNTDSLSVSGADTLLAQPADSNQTSMPPVANNAIVINQEVPPLAQTQAPVSNVSVETPDPSMIQKALKNLGLYQGEVDGKMGPKTKRAIKEFQKQNNLQADGKVGSKTWALLKNSLESSVGNGTQTETQKK